MNQIRLTPKLYTIREKISNLLGLTVLIGFALLGLTTWNLFHDHYANAATIFVIFIGITLQLLATPAPSEIDEANLLKEPNIRITGCSHQVLRMLQWIDQGACPICMTASAGMHKDALQKAEGELAKFKHLTFGTYTTDDDRIINMQRCTRFNSTPNDLQWKWRHVDTLPKDFNIMEAEAAILDCFISQGGAHVWSGDGSSCAAQIVEAVWRRGEAASMFSLLGYVFWNNPVTSRPFWVCPQPMWEDAVEKGWLRTMLQPFIPREGKSQVVYLITDAGTAEYLRLSKEHEDGTTDNDGKDAGDGSASADSASNVQSLEPPSQIG